MKLTAKNVKKFLKQKDTLAPCKEGMKAFEKLLKQKKSMEYVFNRMLRMRTKETQISYAQWAHNQLRYHFSLLCLRDMRIDKTANFSDFKRLFEKLSES